MQKDKKINVTCNECRFFYITHDARNPWGCRHFGFKTAIIPAQAVLKTSGTNCAYKTAKSTAKNKKGL
ncbi:MAG: hypothetical protein HOH05_02400 [Marinovum sp.]|nr:hypothetical protein [Marinovum sp.]